MYNWRLDPPDKRRSVSDLKSSKWKKTISHGAISIIQSLQNIPNKNLVMNWGITNQQHESWLNTCKGFFQTVILGV